MSKALKTTILILAAALVFALALAGWFALFHKQTGGTNSNTNRSSNTNSTSATNSHSTTPSQVAIHPDLPTNVPADDDRDGLTNDEEATHGTDAKNADSDNDGVSDGLEVHTYHTDPLKKDTDGDGISDGAEIKAGTNPNGTGTLLDLQKAISAQNSAAH